MLIMFHVEHCWQMCMAGREGWNKAEPSGAQSRRGLARTRRNAPRGTKTALVQLLVWFRVMVHSTFHCSSRDFGARRSKTAKVQRRFGPQLTSAIPRDFDDLRSSEPFHAQISFSLHFAHRFLWAAAAKSKFRPDLCHSCSTFYCLGSGA